jgi:hypothetical protein
MQGKPTESEWNITDRVLLWLEDEATAEYKADIDFVRRYLEDRLYGT